MAIFSYIEQVIKNRLYRFKGLCLKLYLLVHGCKIGKNLKCVEFPFFRIVPNKNISLGDNITIGTNIIFEAEKDSQLQIGNNVNLTHNIIISVNQKISIGNDCLIAENVSIRDANHKTEKSTTITKQQSDIKPVIIGNDVWIGANSIILKGSTLLNGCVIGANSLTNEKTTTEEYGIYAGSPIKFIKFRS